MINLSKYFLTLALGAAVFGAVACSNSSDSLVSSNESDGLASLDDGKKDFFTWSDLQVFDGMSDLPSCEKFEGVAAQVFDEKGFFVCSNNEWEQIGVSVPAYEKLPKCEAAMNDFCVYIEENEKIEASYICDEGEWVKGIQMDGVSLCLKGDDNGDFDIRGKGISYGVDGSCLKGDENGERLCITSGEKGHIDENGVCVVDGKYDTIFIKLN